MARRVFKTISDFKEWMINEDEMDNLDLITVDENSYHLLQDGISYSAKIISSNAKNKSYTIDINGNSYNIQIKDELDLLIEKMGFSTGKDQKIGNIIAPMPGIILDIMVSEGNEIKKGDSLFILEAMKMENVIKAQGDGIIKNVMVNKADAVDKGQMIIEMA